MSSTIKLYEHNQKAYDALLDMLGERDRACVIKPTGTGKFVIIAKMVQDNPDKRFLLLGTNDYMFNDQKHGIGSVTYWVAVVERAMEDAVMGWLPCDRDGVTEDEEGMVPDDATVAYISTLDGSREERAFELAKHDYYGFLDYKEDRYTTVYGYMD